MIIIWLSQSVVKIKGDNVCKSAEQELIVTTKQMR